MKKILFVFLFLLPSFLFSEVYKSNEIWQKKEVLPSLSGNGYEIYKADNVEILYYDGVEKERIEYTRDGYEKKSSGKSERVFYSKDGTIERRIIEDGGEKKEINYFYDGTLLKSVNISKNGEVERIDYITDSSGALIKIIYDNSTIYLPHGGITYLEGDGVVSYFSENDKKLIKREEEDLSYTLEDSTSIEYYDKNGRLIKKEVYDKYSEEYYYKENGERDKTIKNEGNKIVETIYIENKVDVVIERDNNGNTLLERRTLPDGAIEEIRYLGGKKRYRFVFELDGKRVREAEVL